MALEAQRRELYSKMHDLRMSRMAWAEADVVRSELEMYRSQIARIDGIDGGAPLPRQAASFLDLTGGRRKG